ncbi:MAG: 30S ribosomal protein S17e [Aigarchaeota archaeon]|nr:30S ribosomal protein S17e [Candidatus Pelearchaeum maunauluense]
MRTRKVKTLAKEILETYSSQVSTSFEQNKLLVRQVLEGRFSKRLANRIAGYLTTLAKREAKAKEAEEESIVEAAPEQK